MDKNRIICGNGAENAELRARARELAKGAYDLHIHTIPSHAKRALDDLELIREADALGMAGGLIKNHYEPTGSRAIIANRSGQYKTKAYGGVALNWPVGGLNPYAVESALNLGAVMVWAPTRDAWNSLLHGDMPGDFFKRPGIRILDENGELLPVIHDIFDVILKYDGCLATGHLSPEESVILCKAARARNVRTVLTHPEFERTRIPVDVQKELAAIGVVIEKCWYNIAEQNCTEAYMMETVREVGAARIYLSTDRGQEGRERPAEAMLLLIEALLRNGFTDREIGNLIREVPASVVKN